MGWQEPGENQMLVTLGLEKREGCGGVGFHCTFFSSDAEWFASARPGVDRGLAGLVLGWLGWDQTGWAGVGLVGPVLDWLCQCRSSCAGVGLVVLVSVQLCQWLAGGGGAGLCHGAARLCWGRDCGCFKQISCAVKTFY